MCYSDSRSILLGTDLSLIVVPLLIEDVLVDSPEYRLTLESRLVLRHLGRVFQSLPSGDYNSPKLLMYIQLGFGIRMVCRVSLAGSHASFRILVRFPVDGREAILRSIHSARGIINRR